MMHTCFLIIVFAMFFNAVVDQPMLFFSRISALISSQNHEDSRCSSSYWLYEDLDLLRDPGINGRQNRPAKPQEPIDKQTLERLMNPEHSENHTYLY